MAQTITINIKTDPRIYYQRIGIAEGHMETSVETSLEHHALLAEKLKEKLREVDCSLIELDMVGTNMDWRFKIVDCCFWKRLQVWRISRRFRKDWRRKDREWVMEYLKKTGRTKKDLKQYRREALERAREKE